MRELDLPPVVASEVAMSVPRLARLLGYPEGRRMEDGARGVLHEAGRSFAESACVQWRAVSVTIESLNGDAVALEGGVSLSSAALAARLRRAGAPAVVVGGITLGADLDHLVTGLNDGGRPDHSFFLDAVTTCALEVLAKDLYARVCDDTSREGLVALPRTAPGYGSWDLSDQPRLAAILTTGPGFPVSVLESCMLTPMRSILCLFPLTSDPDLANAASVRSPCDSCGAAACAYRRADRRVEAGEPLFVPGSVS